MTMHVMLSDLSSYLISCERQVDVLSFGIMILGMNRVICYQNRLVIGICCPNILIWFCINYSDVDVRQTEQTD